MNWLVLNLLIAHVFGDFYCQTDSFCKNKFLNSFSGKELWIHAICIAVLSGIAVWADNACACFIVLFITITHIIIDWIKSKVQKHFNILKEKGNQVEEGKNSRWNIVVFLLDQALHIGIIVAGAYCLSKNGWQEFECVKAFFESHHLWAKTSIAMLLAMEPVNVLMLLILKFFRINTSALNDDRKSSNSHSGKLIGYLERGLIIIFVVLSKYEVIGLLIAAKTIRIDASGNIEKSDYILTGTLLSLAFALLLGLLVIRIPL